jgi:hypothetical protein
LKAERTRAGSSSNADVVWPELSQGKSALIAKRSTPALRWPADMADRSADADPPPTISLCDNGCARGKRGRLTAGGRVK